MEDVGTLENATQKLMVDITKSISKGRSILHANPDGLKDGLKVLNDLRAEVYEDLNQIQHEALLVEAIQFMESQNRLPRNIHWLWNPRQTGDSSEPDIRGIVLNKIMISAEATTSETPRGKIDKRMKSTLEKLSKMEGELFYFVRSEKMLTRALTKVAKLHFNIKVIKCSP